MTKPEAGLVTVIVNSMLMIRWYEKQITIKVMINGKTVSGPAALQPCIFDHSYRRAILLVTTLPAFDRLAWLGARTLGRSSEDSISIAHGTKA